MPANGEAYTASKLNCIEAEPSLLTWTWIAIDANLVEEWVSQGRVECRI